VAVQKRVDAVEKRDDCQDEVSHSNTPLDPNPNLNTELDRSSVWTSFHPLYFLNQQVSLYFFEVRRLEELLRLARIALEKAEEVARLAKEWEEQKDLEAKAAAELLSKREEQQEIAEEEHRRSTADLKVKRSIEEEKVSQTRRREKMLAEANRLLKEAQEIETEAIASAEQSTRVLYAKQYEVCCSDVDDSEANMLAWRAEDLKEVRLEEQKSAEAWWTAEQARIKAEKSHLEAASAEEEHRMWDLRHNFEFGHTYTKGDKASAEDAHQPVSWRSSPSSPGTRHDTEDIKSDIQDKATELRKVADEFKSKYHMLLELAKQAHEVARKAGQKHGEESEKREDEQSQKVSWLGPHILAPLPARWTETYVTPLMVTYQELPPLAGKAHYILSDRWKDDLSSAKHDENMKETPRSSRISSEPRSARSTVRSRNGSRQGSRMSSIMRDESEDDDGASSVFSYASYASSTARGGRY